MQHQEQLKGARIEAETISCKSFTTVPSMDDQMMAGSSGTKPHDWLCLYFCLIQYMYLYTVC